MDASMSVTAVATDDAILEVTAGNPVLVVEDVVRWKELIVSNDYCLAMFTSQKCPACQRISPSFYTMAEGDYANLVHLSRLLKIRIL